MGIGHTTMREAIPCGETASARGSSRKTTSESVKTARPSTVDAARARRAGNLVAMQMALVELLDRLYTDATIRR